MASEYRIHRPFVLATLPKPLDHTEGNIVAREVYGQRDGQKKRKRTELVVGVDGETTSIFDVPGSRLITSYPIPPQESFTCPPYSVRIRPPNSADAQRYTFIATKDAGSHKITVFKDVAHRDGKTTSTTVSQTLRTSAVRFLTCSSHGGGTAAGVGDVIVVCQDGELVCLSGETLTVRWVSSSKSIVQDVVATTVSSFHIEYAASGSIAEFNEGMFKNRPEVFNSLPRALDSAPELLVLVSKSLSQQGEKSHLIVLAAMTGDASASPDLQHLVPLDVVPIISADESSGAASSFQVDVQSGALLHFQQGSLFVYNLTGAVPKLKSSLEFDGAVSFARLHRPFVLAASMSSIGLYNYQYRSVHSRATLDWSELPIENQSPRSCQLISYLRSQDIVVALVDNVLVSIQVEAPRSNGKRRKEGLLIDSIGRGTAPEYTVKRLKCEASSIEFSNQLPGTMNEDYLVQFQLETETSDKLLANNELAQWEGILRNKFGVGLREQVKAEKVVTNGDNVKKEEEEDSEMEDLELQELPEWDWLPQASVYSAVDRRWIIYAISQVFSVDAKEALGGDAPRPELRLVLPESNVLTYLAVAGHLTLSNLRSAFRDELVPAASESKALAGDLIKCLTDADLSMTILLNYLRATKIGEVELLLVIKALMQSMELVSGGKLALKLLKNESHGGDNGESSYEMDLDDLERGIAITEHYLGDETDSRSRGLTLAFTKLWRLPAVSTVKALRDAVSIEDIMSLIYLLRVELLRGAWTSLYIDKTSFESEGNEPPPDGVIALIADLLGRCLDAVGAGGWLVNDAAAGWDSSDTSDFLTALRLEVTAALEGIEEAVYLNGIVSEAVRFNSAAQRSGAVRQTWNSNKPISMHLESAESRLLPLGLKTKQLPTKDKVVSGGEVVQRSMRETGHLISQKVEVYSLEKLAI